MKTVKEVIEFFNAASTWANQQDGVESKLKYAVEKMKRRLAPIIDDYRDGFEDMRIDFCSEDEKGNVLRDERNNLVFNKEGLRNLNKRNRELLASEAKFDPYFATQLPEHLDSGLREIFQGFVIKEEEEADE